jgi:glycosyltransferase involved in cell wall biosynthesis
LNTLNSVEEAIIHVNETKSSGIFNNNFKDLYEFINKYKKNDNRILLSIIMPMFNEEHTIVSVLEELPKGPLIEIIVVDDHSTDNSVKEIERINKQNEIKVIHHQRNKGYGAAIITGIKNAKGKVIVTMDSDGQHSPYDILTMVKPIFENEADYTIGSRYLGSYFYQLPVSTRLGELFVQILIQLFFGKRILNNQNGFRAFNRKVIHIFDDVKYEGYAFCTEQIIKATLEGLRIKECPIRVYEREFGSSNIILNKLALNLFSLSLQYLLKGLKMTAIKRVSPSKVNIYEKEVKRSKIYSSLNRGQEFKAMNPVFFIETSTFNR